MKRTVCMVVVVLLLLAVSAPSTGDGWCGDDTTCGMVFGEEEVE